MKNVISVIVSVFNTGVFISQCIESILSQTYDNLEIVLVDGGSTDCAGKICDEYAIKDSRIRVIHKENKGVTSDRKAGLKNSVGEYITFVDGDDWLSENMYKELLETALKTDADIVTSGVIREYSNSYRVYYDGIEAGTYDCSKDGYLQNNMVWIGNTYNKGLHPALWNKLFKRNVIYDNYLMMDDLIIHNEDEAALIAAVLDSSKVAVVHDTFYHYRGWEGASSRKQDELFFERFNRWMDFLRSKLEKKEHSQKLEDDIDKLALDNIVWGMESHFKFIGDNLFCRYVFKTDELTERDIVIYGAGIVGRSYYKQLIRNERYKIVAWVDKSADIYSDKVTPVETLMDISYDLILVAVKNKDTAEQIKGELINLGISAHKIKWYEPIYVLDSIFS